MPITPVSTTVPNSDLLNSIVRNLAKIRGLLPSLPRDWDCLDLVAGAVHEADRSIARIIMDMDLRMDLELILDDRDSLLEWVREDVRCLGVRHEPSVESAVPAWVC